MIERCRSEVAAIADAALSHARGAADLGAALAAIDAAVVQALVAGRPEGQPPPACGPGCATCCTINVGTLAVEGAAAAEFLRARLSPAAARTLAERLAAFHDRIRWLEDRERIAGRETCPLLDGRGACSIYPVRPLACRSVSSLDAEDCRRAISDDDEEASLVRMDLLQHALYAGALEELADALARRGLDARRRDVSGMTALFLADPAVTRAFLAGSSLAID